MAKKALVNKQKRKPKFSTRFYNWAQRWAEKERQAARMRHGDDRAPVGRRVRTILGLWRTRVMVEILRRLKGGTHETPAVSEAAF